MRGNTAILTYAFDGSLFEYVGFTAANGVTVLDTVPSGGQVKITVMKGSYDIDSFGDITLRAKDNALLVNGFQVVSLIAQYVVKNDAGDKESKTLSASASFTTFGNGSGGQAVQGDTNGDGIVDMIDLSNMIDWFGIDNTNTEWNTKYIFLDFNNNGVIDISDIAYVAEMIRLDV